MGEGSFQADIFALGLSLPILCMEAIRLLLSAEKMRSSVDSPCQCVDDYFHQTNVSIGSMSLGVCQALWAVIVTS